MINDAENQDVTSCQKFRSIVMIGFCDDDKPHTVSFHQGFQCFAGERGITMVRGFTGIPVRPRRHNQMDIQLVESVDEIVCIYMYFLKVRPCSKVGPCKILSLFLFLKATPYGLRFQGVAL